jgi:prepilin-type N-terminal cleavage/methylation domain-containing protein
MGLTLSYAQKSGGNSLISGLKPAQPESIYALPSKFLNSMNITPRQMMSTRRQAGFSLIEMIGVLAIIAVLAVIIVPKVFSTIASSRITNAVGSIGAMKSAVAEYAGRYGTIPLTTTNANARVDDLLFSEGLLDGRFIVKIGAPVVASNVATYNRANGVWAGGVVQTGQSRIICQTATAVAPAAANGANFQLTGNTNIPAGSRVISAVIVNATIGEARELSLRIDGDAGSTTVNNALLADGVGRVVYAAPANGVTTVYIYVAAQ